MLCSSWTPLPTVDMPALLMLLVAATRGTTAPITAAAASASPSAAIASPITQPITAADLATANRTAVSYEGSWSWLQLSPANATANPFSLGVLSLLSFRSIWPDVLSATVGGRPCVLDPIATGGASAASGGYVWRPDVVTLRGSCAGGSDGAGVNISMEIAYVNNCIS